jgi:hypothetical protein
MPEKEFAELTAEGVLELKNNAMEEEDEELAEEEALLGLPRILGSGTEYRFINESDAFLDARGIGEAEYAVGKQRSRHGAGDGGLREGTQGQLETILNTAGRQRPKERTCQPRVTRSSEENKHTRVPQLLEGGPRERPGRERPPPSTSCQNLQVRSRSCATRGGYESDGQQGIHRHDLAGNTASTGDLQQLTR